MEQYLLVIGSGTAESGSKISKHLGGRNAFLFFSATDRGTDFLAGAVSTWNNSSSVRSEKGFLEMKKKTQKINFPDQHNLCKPI